MQYSVCAISGWRSMNQHLSCISVITLLCSALLYPALPYPILASPCHAILGLILHCQTNRFVIRDITASNQYIKYSRKHGKISAMFWNHEENAHTSIGSISVVEWILSSCNVRFYYFVSINWILWIYSTYVCTVQSVEHSVARNLYSSHG